MAAEEFISLSIENRRLLMLPAWVGIALAFGMLFKFGNDWDLISAVVFIPSFLFWSGYFLVRAGVDFWRGKWTWGALCLAAYAVTLPAMAGAAELGWSTGDYVHLCLKYPVYLAQIRSHAGKPAELTFYWGTTGMVGSAETARYLIYDPTDTLAKDIGTNPTPFGGWMTFTHLTGHFYVREDDQ